MDIYRRVQYGIAAGTATSVLTAPIDRAKILQQVSEKRVGLYQCLRSIYRNDGLKGYYRGLSGNIIAQSSFYGSFFPVYHLAKVELKNHIDNDAVVHGASSLIATTGASFVSNPAQVVKVRHQTAISGFNSEIPKIYTVARNICRDEGFMALYKGYGLTQMKNSSLAIQLPIYEYLRSEDYHPFLSGTIARTAASSVSYPLDTLRTIRRDDRLFRTYLRMIREIYAKEGLIGFYRGYMAHLIKSVPGAALVFCMYDYFTYDDL
jgi:solute carrier family 25 phosphate transporter 23/24/25/41